MENNIYYNYHKNKYPLMEKQDIIKLVFQSTLGPNHFGGNLSKEKINNYLINELNSFLINKEENFYEWISSKYVRINLFKYKDYNLDLNNLLEMFYTSANTSSYNKELLKDNLLKYLNDEDLKDYNYQAVSHSETYRNNYNPHYRVVKSSYIDLNLKYIQLFNFINNQKNKSIIAIEGRCASGKTTLSNLLEKDFTVIRVDDFFIEKNSKKENISKYGNINYQNLYTVLKEIKNAFNNNLKSIIFKAFDCTNQSYYDKTIKITNKIILEGTYSSSLFFKEFIDKLCFLNVCKEIQYERISNRSLAKRFFEEWIPLEEQYFANNDPISTCDIII